MTGLVGMVEALLFASGEPLSVRELEKATEWDGDAVREALEELGRSLRDGERGLVLVEIAGGWQLATRPEYAAAVGRLLAPRANRLSKPALETVTIVAYRQPVTQLEIEAIRGVACDAVLRTLMERELIHEAGRKPTPGRPILYGTTPAFLHYFGLADIEALPPLPDDSDAEDRSSEATQALSAAGVDA
ncbi:MAG: SMC-Scp complex subunit ScpB [Armatimonadota bacterium]